jgi:hypothetical protein
MFFWSCICDGLTYLYIQPYMRIFAFIMLFFLGGSCVAQPLEKMEKLLANKNFSAFKAYTDSAAGKNNLDFNWKILSEIMPGYEQAVVSIQQLLPYTKKGDGGNVNNYTVRLLEHNGDIFYYDYCVTKYNEKDRAPQAFEDTLALLKNIQAYADFKNVYVTTFHDTLNEKELFTTEVYGQGCGLVEEVPEGQVQLDSLLANNNIEGIRRWLKSPIAERQLYAIYGYRILKGAGYTLTEEEASLLKMVQQKKTTVETCGGCIFGHASFRSMVKEIEEIPEKYLAAKVHRQERLFSRFPIKNKNETMAIFLVPAVVIGVIVIVLYRKKYSKV